MLLETLMACGHILLCAGLNRVRGDKDMLPEWLPGRALFWIAPIIGLLAWGANPEPITVMFAGRALTATWYVGAAFAIGYLFWGIWSWGYAFAGLGGVVPNRAPSALERILQLFGPPVVQTFTRMMFAIVGVALVAWLIGNWWFLIMAPVFALITTAVYVLLFRPLGRLDWLRAEAITGAVWGGLTISARWF